MASSRRGRGWHLLHHLLHPLFQHQHHHLPLPHLLHCLFHQLPPLQSKKFHWRLRHPVVEAPEPNFMEDPPSASTPYVSAGGGPPSNASTANVAPVGDEGAHNSPILITESPTSPPRQEALIDQPTQEGGSENQQQAPPAPPQANLSLEVKRVWEPFSAKLKMMAEDFPSIISKAVESSTRKLQDDLFALRTENSTIKIETERLSCNLTLAEIEHSRVEDAMSLSLIHI